MLQQLLQLSSQRPAQRMLSTHRHRAIATAWRTYSRSTVVQEENAAKLDQKSVTRQAAKEYAERRVVYRKQVSVLRKQYAHEIEQQRAADQAEEEARRKERMRRKLERQRIKNIRSGQHAIYQREKQEQRRLEFEEELRVAQINRDARKERFAKARQLVIDELEEEAPLWLTTLEEVEDAFTPEAEQLLWTRPRGVLGAPVPTDDAEYWRYESQFPFKGNTLPLARELLLKGLEEEAYMESNMDNSFWTDERLGEREELEEKARLRAMVYDAGKRALLKKQQDILQGRFSEEESKSNIPQSTPVPNVKILANTKAMEKEGVDILLRDPTQFFEFKGRQPTKDEPTEDDDDSGDSSYQGPTMGIPVGLKSPPSYPILVGKLLKADTRTERQKKREEREKKMLEAARAASGDDEDELDVFDLEKIPFDPTVTYESDDEEWINDRGLEPGDDPDRVKMPYGLHYKEEDVDWVISNLENKVSELTKQLKDEIRNSQKEARAVEERKGGSAEVGEESRYSREGSPVDLALQASGIDTAEYEALLASLTPEQMSELMAMDDTGISTPLDEVREKLQVIPGLTDEQVNLMLEVEKTLRSNDEIRDTLGGDEETTAMDIDDDDE